MHKQRNVYLKMKTLEEARRILFDAFPKSGGTDTETVAVDDAVGRILAEPVTARLSSPNYHAAAMDGIAVKAETTFGTSETRPKILEVNRDAFYLNTGKVMPPGTDAVIMIEHVHELGQNRIQIEAAAFPWQNVRKVGEDIVASELLFARNHKVSAYCIGALLAGGVFSVPVLKRPRVLILPTGSELIDWRQTPPETLAPGQVLETNSYVLGKLVEAWGGAYERHRIIQDNLDEIQQAVAQAVRGEFDMVLTLGGSSAGSQDYASHVLQALGEVLVHGVTIMPGKPVIIGRIQGKPFFGIPGYPVSAIIAYEQFVGPLIAQMLGQSPAGPATTQVQLTRKIASKLGVEEFLRVKLGNVNDRIVATPLPRGAGIITSITEADGIVRIPNNVEGITDGHPVIAELLKPLSAVNNTIVVVGSHDNSLDILADQLKAEHTGVTLSSSHVGSMGGLTAIKKGGCHVAGAHLLDTADGSYNRTYIKRFLAGRRIRQVNLVFRDQGLIVARNNPKNIQGLQDLTRENITLINRQSGSGTRILLDYRLEQLDIDPHKISGYTNDEFTHMAVAVAVLSGAADVGLGIYAAARALDLDFIPVVTEQYDLLIPEEFFHLPKIQTLLKTINGEAFKNRVEALGGYSTSQTGTVMN